MTKAASQSSESEPVATDKDEVVIEMLRRHLTLARSQKRTGTLCFELKMYLGGVTDKYVSTRFQEK